MAIRRFVPPPQLAKVVKCYYYIETAEDRLINDTYFADGCVEAVFSLGWEFYKDGQREDWAKIIGQIIKPRKLRIQGRGRSFGIWFYPHTFFSFAKVPVCELNDSVLSWGQIFPDHLSEFIGNCLYDRDLNRLVEGVNDFLLAKLAMHNSTKMDEIIDFAVCYLSRLKGNTDLNKLAEVLNVSNRYLQRAFLTRVGFSQKHFLRVARFQDALRSLSQGTETTLTEVAHAHNFFDQSHFNREFKSFTGFTPSEFQSAKLPINQHFLGVE